MLLLTPLAAAVFRVLEDALLFALVLPECEDCGGFDDLGLLLIGGVFLAVGVGVAFTLIRLRLRDQKAEAPAFISITSSKQDSKLQ
ncbi:MAG: hypothetical protein ABI596_06425 [Pyrinomonadaceae bacterium]